MYVTCATCFCHPCRCYVQKQIYPFPYPSMPSAPVVPLPTLPTWPETTPVKQGWECPRCFKILGPHVDSCACKKVSPITSTTSGNEWSTFTLGPIDDLYEN